MLWIVLGDNLATIGHNVNFKVMVIADFVFCLGLFGLSDDTSPSLTPASRPLTKFLHCNFSTY